MALPAANPIIGAAGLDLTCRKSVVVAPRSISLVPANNAVDIPEGFFMMLAARSSTPLRKGLMLANGVGIIDPYFRGDKAELKLEFYNYGDEPITIDIGECLAQVVLVHGEPIEWQEVESFGTPGEEYMPDVKSRDPSGD